jgi:hypothetical protein
VGRVARTQDRGPREVRRVGFRLGFLARVLYFPCLVLVGRGGAPGLSVFLSDVLVYGLVAFLAFRFFSPLLHPVAPDRLVHDVLAPTGAVPAVTPFAVAPVAVTPVPLVEVTPVPECWVLCPDGVDCQLLQALNPTCTVRRPGQ